MFKSKTQWSPADRAHPATGAAPVQPVETTHHTLIFDMPETERNGLFASSLAAERHGWWDAIDNDALVEDALAYVELENEAVKVRTFKIDLIDGLLQTEDYAAAVVRANVPTASDELIRRRVDARARRQERLTSENPIHVEAVLAEGALRTQVGGPVVMRRQLERLLELNELPTVSIRIVPAAGAYPAMGTPFYLLSFDRGYPDVGYVELLDKGVYLEDPDDVEPYATKFTSLLRVASNQRKSDELIADIARSLC